ncbi:g5348 [Coccomyxa elongata]
MFTDPEAWLAERRSEVPGLARLEAVCPSYVENWWYPGEFSIRDWPDGGADVAPSAAEDEPMAAGVVLGVADIAAPCSGFVALLAGGNEAAGNSGAIVPTVCLSAGNRWWTQPQLNGKFGLV